MEHLLFELLQVSLGNKENLSDTPSYMDWLKLIVIAQQQSIIGVLLDGLERLPKEQLPPRDLLLHWIGLSQMSIVEYSLHCKCARELTYRFQSVGFHSCVLKGIGIAQSYPKPEHRLCGDIDLWTDGNRAEVMVWLKTQGVIDHVVWHHAEVHFFENVPTEIHFHPSWLYNPVYNNRLQKWFDSEMTRQMILNNQLGFAYPSVEFNAVYSLVHLSHHLIEEGIGLRHIVDYYYVMKSLPTSKRTLVISLLKSFSLYKLASAMMWVLLNVCGLPSVFVICEPNEKEGKFLLDEIIRGGNFGHFRKDNRKRNSASRIFALLPHYPSEVLCILPWKLWHKCWRITHKYY